MDLVLHLDLDLDLVTDVVMVARVFVDETTGAAGRVYGHDSDYDSA